MVRWLPWTKKLSCGTRFATVPFAATALVCVAAALLIYQTMTADMVPFIYFQF